MVGHQRHNYSQSHTRKSGLGQPSNASGLISLLLEFPWSATAKTNSRNGPMGPIVDYIRRSEVSRTKDGVQENIGGDGDGQDMLELEHIIG